MPAYIIPMQTLPASFDITLSNVRLTMTLTWRNVGGAGWVLDLASEDGTPLVRGLPLVVGHDMLEQHKHLGIPGGLWVVPSIGDDVPTFDNLGTDCQLFYVT